MKNKIIAFLFTMVVASCVSNQEKSSLKSFYQNSFNEIKENWTISSDDEYFITIQSKPYQLNSYNNICAMKSISLKKDKQLNILPLYEQLVNSQASTFYSLNRGKANCSSISIDKYFYISDINNSDEPNYGIFRIAEIITNKKWLKSGEIEYLDEVSKKCLQENELTIESIYESEILFDNELYAAILSCNRGSEIRRIQLLINENLNHDTFEYRAIDFTGVESLEG